MNPILQGLTISISGIVITFLALGLFILVMVILQKMFPAESEAPDGSDAEKKTIVESSTASDDEGEVVAAIAAAVAYFQQSFNQSGDLGISLNEGRGTWWMVKRINANPTVKIKK